MTAKTRSPEDQLENLLREGRIDRTEYDQLREAMKPRVRGNPEPMPGAAPRERRRLAKSAGDTRLTGVCGGLAAHLGVDPSLVRVGTVILAVVFFPVAVIAYIALALILPWDNPAEARRENPSAPGFAATAVYGALILLILCASGALVTFVVPRFEQMFTSMDAALPMATQIALSVSQVLRTSIAGVPLQILLAVPLTLIFWTLTDSFARSLYSAVTVTLGGLWIVFLLLSMYLPLFSGSPS